MKLRKNGFTLVELIVSITILTILWTIAFLAFQWYSKDARNSTRTSDAKSIRTTLELFFIDSSFYPAPDNSITVTGSGGWVDLWYKWELWDNALTNIGKLSKKPVDPKTWANFEYSTTLNKKEYELAKKKVKEIKGFYAHLFVTIFSFLIILFVNLKFVPFIIIKLIDQAPEIDG